MVCNGKTKPTAKRSIVRRPISSNRGYNSNPAFVFFCSKVFSWIIFPIIFRVSYHQIADKKNQSELAFYAFIFEFTFRNSLGFSSLGLNNPA